MTSPLRAEVIELTKKLRQKVTKYYLHQITSRYTCVAQEDGRRLTTYDDFTATDETQVDCYYPTLDGGLGDYVGTILFIPGNDNPSPIEAISDYGGTRPFMDFLDHLTTECNVEVNLPEPLED